MVGGLEQLTDGAAAAVGFRRARVADRQDEADDRSWSVGLVFLVAHWSICRVRLHADPSGVDLIRPAQLVLNPASFSEGAHQ